ncbi:MAG: H4MPT-linked C1 transfer pathway protein [Blastopirellula sp.]|nr:MAG: H4MPT-linked C1 transfer pathway protein [Blastopirellula sp.]
MSVVAIDIGGANIKLANAQGWAYASYFPLWQKHEQLAEELLRLKGLMPKCDHLAVTMTGELADCFSSKVEGVQFILDAVECVFDPAQTSIYLTSGEFVSVSEAASRPLEAAASNWHALAMYAARFVQDKDGLMIDIGSTSTDIVPYRAGQPIHLGSTDTERLLAGELIYTGVGRTPLCSLTDTVELAGKPCAVAAEFFATTEDIYLVLGRIDEDADNLGTADGRPLTQEFSEARIARMVCADRDQLGSKQIKQLAQQFATHQTKRIANGLGKVLEEHSLQPENILVSGHGRYVIDSVLADFNLLDIATNDLAALANSDASRSGPAYALAVLATEYLESMQG